MEDQVERSRYPRHLYPSMDYPSTLLRDIYVNSGAQSEVKSFAEHILQTQVTRNPSRGNSRGLTVAATSHTETPSDMDYSQAIDSEKCLDPGGLR